MKLKKLLTIIFLSIIYIVSLSSVSAYGQGQGEVDYNLYIQGEAPYNCYTTYWSGAKFYKLKMPCTYEEMIIIDNAVGSGLYNGSEYYYKIVELNYHLLRNGYEPLYY